MRRSTWVNDFRWAPDLPFNDKAFNGDRLLKEIDMQTPTDLSRLMGRYSTVHTTSGTVGGTILAAGSNGITLSVASDTATNDVRNFAPSEVLEVQLRA